MEWLVVLNAAGGLVLVLAGLGKLLAPEGVSGALKSLRLPSGQLAIGAIAGAEIGIGIAGALAGGSPMAWAVAAYWLLLAIAALRLIRKPDVPCGCFGAKDERVGVLHLLVDLAFGGVAVGTALAAEESLTDAADVARGGWAGVSAAAVLLAIAVRFLLAQGAKKDDTEPALADGPALTWAPSPPVSPEPELTPPPTFAPDPDPDPDPEPEPEPALAGEPTTEPEPALAAEPTFDPEPPPVPDAEPALAAEPTIESGPEPVAAVIESELPEPERLPDPPPPPPPPPPPASVPAPSPTAPTPAAAPVERVLSGVTPDGSPIELGLTGHARPTLLAFLTDTCVTCREFWQAFGEGATPPGIDVVIVTMGPEDESVELITRLAPRSLPTVMSSAAWDDYGVAAGPYFVLLARDGAVTTHGPASTVASLDAMLTAANAG